MKKTILFLTLFVTSLTQAQYTFESTDIWVGTNASSPKHFVEYNNELYFQAKENYQNEIWKTDGTTGNATQVSNLNGNFGSSPESFKVLGNDLIFVAFESATGTELYKYDGTSTTLLKDIRVGSSGGMTGNGNEDYEIFTELNNELLFLAQTQNGIELWKTDGTTTGTILVKNFTETITGTTYYHRLRYMYKGPQKRFLGVVLNNELYFTTTTVNSSNTPNGTDLWKTDGTTAGTVLVNNTLDGIDEMIVYNNMLLFAGNTNSEGIELWKSDGTNAGTVIIEDKFPNNLAAFGKSSSPTRLTIFNNGVYYQGFGYDTTTSEITGYELYKTDGTAITLVKDINPGHLNSGVITPFKIFNSELYFSARDDSASPFTLWKTDGTEVGTVEVFGAVAVGISGDLSFRNATIYNNELFFNHQNQLWKTDGTETGTMLLSNDGTTNTPNFVSSFGFKVFNNKLFMRADIPAESDELWSVFDSTLSIDETFTFKVNVFPNPTIDILTVSGIKNIQNYTIYNILGKTIKSGNLNAQNTIDVSKLSKGIYLLNLKNNNQTYTKKFIKQ